MCTPGKVPRTEIPEPRPLSNLLISAQKPIVSQNRSSMSSGSAALSCIFSYRAFHAGADTDAVDT